MTRINRVALSVSCLAVTVGACCGTAIAGREPSLVVMVPARERVVMLMQDMYGIESMTLIAYQGDPAKSDPVMHRWTGNDWTRIGLEEYGSLSARGKTVILVGDDRTAPSVLVGIASRSGQLKRIETLDIAGVVAGLGDALSLNYTELKWLSDRHGLSLKDLNDERRRYGRWGKSEGVRPAPPVMPQQATETAKPEGSPIPPEPQIAPVGANRPAPVVPTAGAGKVLSQPVRETEPAQKTPAPITILEPQPRPALPAKKGTGKPEDK